MVQTLALVAISLSFIQAFVFAVPSSTPSNGFTCPLSDNAAFPVGITDYTSDPILCTYPASPGDDYDFYCTYSKTTGALVQDQDAGFCPSSAISATIPDRRRGTRVARAPLPSRPLDGPGTPAGPANKVYLKKRRVNTAA